MKLRPALLAPVAALLLVGAGCGQTVAENVVENRVNAQLGTNGNVDVSNGNVSYKGADGTSVTSGANVRIPDDFPAAVPPYPAARVMQAASASENSASLIMATTDSSDKVQAWYKDKLTGWKKAASYAVSGQETTQYTNGKESIMVMTGAGADAKSDAGTTVTVIWSKE